jgi:hypothetical protein
MSYNNNVAATALGHLESRVQNRLPIISLPTKEGRWVGGGMMPLSGTEKKLRCSDATSPGPNTFRLYLLDVIMMMVVVAREPFIHDHTIWPSSFLPAGTSIFIS